MDKIRILVVDDHAMLRMGLIALLGTVDNFTVVGEAENGVAAIAKAKELRPNIILMDVMMPQKDGIEATQEILSADTGVKVILLTSSDSTSTIARGLKLGAKGAMLKSSDFSALVSTINDVVSGKTIIAPEIQRLLKEDPPVTELSARQQEILQSIVNGLFDKDIAQQLGISIYTVKEHINTLFQKIGAANRTEAVAIALRKHLLKI